MATESLNEDDIQRLAGSIRGIIVTPDTENYDEVRQIWNGLIDRHPKLIVQCQGAADVANTVEFANEHGIDFSIRSGGHHQTGTSLVDNGLVIDLSEMNSVHIDPDNQVARVDPGCRARDLLIEAQHYGLAAPTGSAGDVGISGSTLGGGIGWIRRKHGLGIDALHSVDVVTPDGDLVKASREENEDLFWALRGGGGNFGIVTSFEFELIELGPLVAGLGVFYPGDEAETVLREYRELTQDAPDELTTVTLNSHVPHFPPIPDELAGKDAIAVMGCYAGDLEEGQKALRPFRELSEPLLDMSEPMPYMMLHQLGTMMFPEGRNYCHHSIFIDDLGDDVINQVVTGTAERPSRLCGIGTWHLGGAISDSDNGAFPWRDKEYMIVVESNWEEGDDNEHLSWAEEMDEEFRELGGVGAYGGFAGIGEGGDEQWAELVYGDNLQRLAEIKADYDRSNKLDKNINVVHSDG